MSESAQQQYNRVRQHMQQGQFAAAADLCEGLLEEMPGHVPTLQLLAMAAQQAGRNERAEAAFQELLAIAPDRAELVLGYGRFLRSMSRVDEAETQLLKASEMAPQAAGVWHSLALLYLAEERPADARASAERMARLSPTNAAAWELCAAASQRLGDVATAMDYCREGLEHVPQAERLHYSLAQLLREDCSFDASAQAYEEARKQGFEAPDLYRNWSEALLESGDGQAALACAAQGTQRYPEHAVLQRMTARLHHEVGAPGDPLAGLYAAARANPRQAALWQTLVELLKRLERSDEAVAALGEAQRIGVPLSPELAALDALAAAERGDEAGALQRFDQAVEAFPDHPYVLVNFAMQLLSSGDPAKADEMCRRLLERNPYDQLALTYRGTAWQLLGDPREQWLLDYERMVIPVEVPLPDGYTDRALFFAEVQGVLEELHRTQAQPIEQSVRGGTQTNGFLFRLKHPLLATLEQQIRKAIVSAMATFPDDPRHPFWSRRHREPTGDGLRFSGAWSVRLRDQGFHANHVHPEGWVSSALYIALPDEVATGDGIEGHIQFGSPMTELGLDLAPRRTVKPTVGTLVLFPSYMWHGTVPFHSDEPRITVAFDLQPQA